MNGESKPELKRIVSWFFIHALYSGKLNWLSQDGSVKTDFPRGFTPLKFPVPPARAISNASPVSFGYVHAHDTGAVEDDAAAAGDDALDGLTSFGMLRKRFVFHLLHDLKALGFLAFFLGNGLVNVCGHSVCAGEIVRPVCVGRKAGRCG